MASSSKESNTAAAAEQHGSISLCESAERKDSGAEPTTKSGTTPTKIMAGGTAAPAEQLGSFAHLLALCFCLLCCVLAMRRRMERKAKPDAEKNGTPTKLLCSACEKKSDTLMKCRACKCVFYCDKKCQNKHWKEHKHECKVIKKELDKRGGKLDVGTELDVAPLGKLPPQEECPICMRVLPTHGMLQTYAPCCGKTICSACDYQHSIKTTEENDKRAQKKQPTVPRTCEFCREPVPKSEAEYLVYLRKRFERKDPEALFHMALYYRDGDYGMPVDQRQCLELLRASSDLGYTPAHFQLGYYYDTGGMGLEQNEEEAIKYFEEAAEGGDILARHNLGCAEEESGDDVAAMRHWRLAASGGSKASMDGLIAYFEDGLFHHSDLAEALQAFYRSRAEMRSVDRDRYIEHLKETGEYRKENCDF